MSPSLVDLERLISANSGRSRILENDKMLSYFDNTRIDIFRNLETYAAIIPLIAASKVSQGWQTTFRKFPFCFVAP